MAQIIKNRRGSINNVKDVTTQNAEILVASGSIGDLSGPFILYGSPSQADSGLTGVYKPASKIYQGATVPTILSASYGNVLDGTPFYAVGNNTLYILSSAGNTTMNLAGNLSGSVLPNITASGSFSGSFQGNGSGLTNISASSVVGLNLNQIDSGSVTASVNIGPTIFQVVSGSTEFFSIYNNGAVEYGLNTIASGSYSHAEGYTTTASGDYSHAEGYETLASGEGSHAEGYLTIASGFVSHAEGWGTLASGDYSHTEGRFTTASGDYSHAEGYLTKAIGFYSHAEGYYAIADGQGSHAEGFETTASGDYSHAEGQGTIASGSYSHAKGLFSIALGEYSHAEGNTSQALGYSSHAEGQYTQAIGEGSHAEGGNTIALGNESHAEGSSTVALGINSHTEGIGTIASGSYQHVQGKYNIANTSSLMIIGNGTSDLSRSNIVDVKTNSVEVTGSLIVTNGITGSLLGTASYALNATTSSYALNATSASYASTAGFALTIADGLNITASNILVNQNLVVIGTASFGYTKTVTGSAVIIGDSFIILNADSPTAPYAGIMVYDTGSNSTASFEWNGNNDYWIAVEETGQSAGFLTGPSGSKGSEVFPSLNRVLKGTGNNTVVDTNITDTGTLVSINSNTQVTGSLFVSAGITGSLLGTASYAAQALTSSYALNATSASYALNATSASYVNILNQNVTISGSLNITNGITGSLLGTASYAAQALTSSYALQATSASYALNASTASYVNTLFQNLVVSGTISSTGNISAPYLSGSSGIYDGSSAGVIQFSYMSAAKTLAYITPSQSGDLIQYSGSIMVASNLIDGGTF